VSSYNGAVGCSVGSQYKRGCAIAIDTKMHRDNHAPMRARPEPLSPVFSSVLGYGPELLRRPRNDLVHVCDVIQSR
jgi:hypothetical protein